MRKVKVGDLIVQRTLQQSMVGVRTPQSADKEQFWRIKSLEEHNRCTLVNEKNEVMNGMLSEHSTPVGGLLRKGCAVFIFDQYDSGYENYGPTGIAFHSSSFSFPLEDTAPSWMQNLELELKK
jgi:hypothetical protein